MTLTQAEIEIFGHSNFGDAVQEPEYKTTSPTSSIWRILPHQHSWLDGNIVQKFITEGLLTTETNIDGDTIYFYTFKGKDLWILLKI